MQFSEKVAITVTCATLQAVVLLVLGRVPKMAVRYGAARAALSVHLSPCSWAVRPCLRDTV